MPLAEMPTVPGVTASCVALRPPPTPAHTEPLVIAILRAVALVTVLLETIELSSVKPPATATKPPMEIPTVPPTLSAVAPERSTPRCVPGGAVDRQRRPVERRRGGDAPGRLIDVDVEARDVDVHVVDPHEG